MRSPKTSATPRVRRGRPITPAQEALQITWVLKGHLKNAQISYLRVGVLLAKVRDRKLYAALRHPDIESYAARRLGLQRASLYRYLQVHDWIRTSHPEWLAPRPKGFIPDLADAFALIWIEKRLARKDLSPEERAGLESLRLKALAGELTQKEYQEYRRRGHRGSSGLRAFLTRLRFLRMRGSQIAAMPAEVIAHLDGAIEALLERLGGKARGAQQSRFDVKKTRRKHLLAKHLRQSLFK